MTTETRYFRSDAEDSYYKLLTANTTSSLSLSTGSEGELYPCIGVRIRNQNGDTIVDWTETAVISTSYTLYTINVNVPSTYVGRVIVDVRVRVDGTNNTRSFRTEEINTTISGTWNFKLWAKYSYNPTSDFTMVYFIHGNDTYNSRIENFTYSSGQLYEISVDATCQLLSTPDYEATYNISNDAAVASQSLTVAETTFNLSQDALVNVLGDAFVEVVTGIIQILKDAVVSASAVSVFEVAFSFRFLPL